MKEPNQEFVIVVADKSKVAMYNKLLEDIRKRHLQKWGKEDGWVYLSFDVFSFGDSRIPIADNHLSAMEALGSPVQAWYLRSPGWRRAPWLEAILYQADGTDNDNVEDLKKEITSLKLTVGSYKGHSTQWENKYKELLGSKDNKSEALRQRLMRREKKIELLEKQVKDLLDNKMSTISSEGAAKANADLMKELEEAQAELKLANERLAAFMKSKAPNGAYTSRLESLAKTFLGEELASGVLDSLAKMAKAEEAS